MEIETRERKSRRKEVEEREGGASYLFKLGEVYREP